MKIFGISIHSLKYIDFFYTITQLKQQYIVFTPNPEILLETLYDSQFKKNIENADFLVPDGIGLYLAAQILDEKNIACSILKLPYFAFKMIFDTQKLYKKYGEKICGSDLTNDLLHFAQEKQIKICILDPYFPNDKKKCTAQEHFGKNLKIAFPDLKFDFFIYKEKDKEKIIKKISESKSAILFSTLGMKKQEKSVLEIMKKCKNIKLGLGVGSSFDYLIGFQKRAPKIFRKLGIEWLYRIITGPQKIKRVKRLWNAIFVFTWEVYKNKLSSK